MQLHIQTGAAGQTDTPAAPVDSAATHTDRSSWSDGHSSRSSRQCSYTHRQEQLVRWTLQPLLQTVQLHTQTGAAGQTDTPAAPVDSPATHTNRSNWSDGHSSRSSTQSSYTHTDRNSWLDGLSSRSCRQSSYTHRQEQLVRWTLQPLLQTVQLHTHTQTGAAGQMDTPAAPADSPATHTDRSSWSDGHSAAPVDSPATHTDRSSWSDGHSAAPVDSSATHTQTGTAGQTDTPAAPVDSAATHTDRSSWSDGHSSRSSRQCSYTHRQEQLVRWTLQPLLQTVQLHTQTGAAGQTDTPAAPVDSPATHTNRSNWSDGHSSRSCRQCSYTYRQEQLVRWTLQPLLQTVQLHTQTGAAGQMDTPAAPAHSPATHTQTGTAG